MIMKQSPIMQKLSPFLGLGIVLVFFVLAIVFLSYVFVIGAVIGLVLFVITWVRNAFSKKQPVNSPQADNSPHIGNVYDHDEFKK
jgi:uncharacterized membrane protein